MLQIDSCDSASETGMQLQPSLEESIKDTPPSIQGYFENGFYHDISISTLLQMFIEQVGRTPNNVAMVDTASLKSITYQQLYKSALKLSSFITNVSASNPKCINNEFVAILLPASFQHVKSTLAIWLAGKIPVPLNIDYPMAQLKYILEDQLQNPLIITKPETLQMIGLELHDPKSQFISADKIPLSSQKKTSTNTPASCNCNDIAYCFFTSGSTGRPKGVLVRHASYVNVVHWAVNECKLVPSDRAAVVCAPTFDVSILEIWPILSVGGCLCLPRNHYRYDANLLAEWMRDERITIAALPTTVGSRILSIEENKNLGSSKRTSSLRWMIIGGEALLKFPSPDLPFRVMNIYGPTEAAVLATCVPVDGGASQVRVPKEKEIPSIGKAINEHVRVYLMDQDSGLQVTCPGEVGEICIAGVGLAVGYLNEPQLTAQKFIPNPFEESVNQSEQRERFGTIYKSGDLGYWNEEGNLCYVGRIDHKIKLYGFRIELGNIEQALSNYPGIEQAVVLVEEDKVKDKDNKNERKVLVAYCTVRDWCPESVAQLQDNLYPFLKTQLGHYELPTQIYILPSSTSTSPFPLTTAGKIDRKKLPQLKSVAVIVTPNHEPLETEYEIMVAQTWSELLNIPFNSIGRRDNFFGLGGTSIIALQMLLRLQCMIEHKQLKIAGVHLHHIFRAQTVYELAQLVEQNIVAEEEQNQGKKAGDMISLSESQRLIWTQMECVPQKDWYEFNQSISIKFRTIPDTAVIQNALVKLYNRHDLLSYTFHFDRESAHFLQSGGAETLPITPDLIDLSQSEDNWTEANQVINHNSRAPFANDQHLVKFYILKLAQEFYSVDIIGHQLLLDVTGFNILIWELQQLVQIELTRDEDSDEDMAAEDENELELKPKWQYADYVKWQHKFVTSSKCRKSLEFWTSYLKDWSPVTSLTILDQRVDLSRQYTNTNEAAPYAGLVIPFQLDSNLTTKLEDYSKERHTTVNNLLITAFSTLLHLYTKSSDIVILSIILGRDELEFNETVGHFTNPIAIRSKCTHADQSITFEGMVHQVCENITQVYEHGEVPYQRVINAATTVDAKSDTRELSNFCINMTPRSPTHLTSVRNLFQTYQSELTSQKLILTFEEVKEDESVIDGFLEADSNIFSPKQLKEFIRAFTEILEAGIDCPTTPIDYLC